MTDVRRSVKVLFWVLVLGLTGIAAALLGELAARWRERHRLRPPGTMLTAYYSKFRLRPALVHNQDYFGWARIDSLGLRGRDVPLQKPAGTLRVLADGGSTTFDTAVSADDSTWPAHLERILNAGGHPGEVLNAGVPGYATLDNLIRLQTELYRLGPDLILQVQGHNDLYDALVVERVVHHTDTPDEIRPSGRLRYWLTRHSVLYGQVAARWRAITGRVRGPRAIPSGDHLLPLDSALLAGEARFSRDLTAYVLIARQLGARGVLVEPLHVSGGSPMPRSAAESLAYASAFPGVPVRTSLDGYHRFRDVVRAVGAATGVPVIQTDDMGLDRAEYFDAADPMHLNDLGARRFAEAVATRLMPLLGEQGTAKGEGVVP